MHPPSSMLNFTGKRKVQSSNKPSPLYASAMQSAGLPANANSK
jgi:hypothetical protein